MSRTKVNFLGEDNYFPKCIVEKLETTNYSPDENGIRHPVSAIDNEGWEATFMVDYYYNNHKPVVGLTYLGSTRNNEYKG